MKWLEIIKEAITATALDGRKIVILHNPAPAVLVERVKRTRALRGVVVGGDCFWANSYALIHVQIAKAVGADTSYGDARLELRWRDGTARLTVLREPEKSYAQIVALPQVQRLVAYLAQLSKLSETIMRYAELIRQEAAEDRAAVFITTIRGLIGRRWSTAIVRLEKVDDRTVRVEKIMIGRQGRGTGSRIMRAIIAAADTMQITLVLNVAAENRSRLRDWYQTLGFGVTHDGWRLEMTRQPKPDFIIQENAGDDYVLTAPVSALAVMYNPFKSSPWADVDRIAPEAVAAAIDRQDFTTAPYDPVSPYDLRSAPNPDYHVKRIAYLVTHRDPQPLVIVPNVRGSYELDDGFHRLAAAIYRGDATIRVAFGGTRRQLRMWLGI